MKRLKQKSVQTPKGTQKISDFFINKDKSTKSTTNIKEKIVEQIKNQTSVRENDDSDVVFVFEINDASFTPNHLSSKAQCETKTRLSPLARKRKAKECDNLSPPVKRCNQVIERELSPDSCPSTNQIRKVDSKSKTVTLEKTQVKQSTSDTTSTQSPERQTPSKQKRTPKKLFERSPNNLNEFNVQILNSFIKITPSKNNKVDPDVEFVKSSEKKQSSILKYLSPDVSAKSLHAQRKNESTPTKESQSIPASETPKSKVKTRLDFSDFAQTSSLKLKNCDSHKERKNTTMIPEETTSPEVTVKSPTNNSSVSNKGQENDFNFTNVDISFGENWEELEELSDSNYTLDLTISQHCKVINVSPFSGKNVITLKSTKNGEKAICNLEGFWMNTPISIGDTLRVTAKKINEREWLVDNNYGLLVYEPDLLISTTSVVNTLWCKRKSVLSDRFSGFEPSNQHMLVGILVHNLLQHVLKHKMKTECDIEKVAKDLVKERNTILRIYECGVTSEIIENELMKFIPKIASFVKLYVRDAYNKGNSNIKHNKDDWKGTIKAIDDIEENIWCPELGIKGKVDVSVRTDFHMMPLELKTGRATVSLEHRGQVMMYIMMMNKLGYNVPSGLLLYLRYNNEDISSKQVLKNIQDEAFFYLDDSHLEYFMHWVSLIALESNSGRGHKNLREIYTLPPEERENNGRCIINLKLASISDESNGMFIHTFEKMHSHPPVNFFANGIMENNYVVVSTAQRPAVSAGFVTDITANSITVTLDRNLKKKYENQIFFIDSYDSTSIQSYNLASLTLLLELTPQAEKLRQIVIDRQPPTFKSVLPKVIGTKGKQILRRLNMVQQRAVLKAIAAKDYFLIKGMPGTGKTATIVALVQLLVELNKTVIVTSHTHSAVDNVCIKLVNYGVKVLRLGSQSRIHPTLKNYSEHYLTKDCTTPEQLEVIYNSAQVIAVTCLGSGHPLLSKRTMDICIVDESTQVLQCSVIRPLYAAKTFILIGDQDQLPAVIQNKEALEMGMSESLFERLYTKEAATALNVNYRMNSPITALANLLTYNGQLSIGSESIANAVLNLHNKESAYKDFRWVLKALDDSIENSVQFLDTGAIWNLEHNVAWATHAKNDQAEQHSPVNIYEAAVTFHLVQALLKAGVPSADIGVIATYRAQVAQISALLQGHSVDVSTVDQFQGKDKNVIIYSATKSREGVVPKPEQKVGSLLL
ncbi:hypothetical protein NQ318_006740 [Aromia moschata]|uniref:DNA replication ATP-dependent helicase/nuclease n=1 Tax=Aromia moschata TaxID=1265417 RepID=A0AAV8YEJ3_9CUCU|nr:hypothetical protein NQ318_006740 [Aromia moschata]